MTYIWKYDTPLEFDNMLISSDGKYLTGLWFIDSKDASKHVGDFKEKALPIFKETCKWLDIYFSGEVPDFIPKYKIENLTPFREEVFKIMNTIPFGSVLTYQDIAKTIALKKGIKKMSNRAVGGAVGWNPIGIIIPCHRVIGSKGNLTGYGGGIKNKIALLTHEKNDMSKYSISKKGTIYDKV